MRKWILQVLDERMETLEVVLAYLAAELPGKLITKGMVEDVLAIFALPMLSQELRDSISRNRLFEDRGELKSRVARLKYVHQLLRLYENSFARTSSYP